VNTFFSFPSFAALRHQELIEERQADGRIAALRRQRRRGGRTNR
jgi:hypothetical protein